MRALWAILGSAVAVFAVAGTASCGEAPSQGGAGQVGFNVYISRAALGSVGSFQIALIERGSRFSCGELTRTCLTAAQGLTRADLVPIEDKQGQSHPTLLIPATFDQSGGTAAQDALLRNVPTGTDYTLVVEALSKDSPPKFLGATCQGRITVRSGNNDPVTPNPIDLLETPDGGLADGGSGLPTCDPRF